MNYTQINKRTSVFLLTRFNLNLFPIDKKNLPTRTESWLSNRFELFENYCFSSVFGQSYKDFIWFVLFDKATPEKYIKRIEALQNKMSNFVPVYFGDEEAKDHPTLIKSVITAHKDESSLLITTRVDNDDALHCDFMKSVVELSKSQHDEIHFYTLKNGLQYYTEANFAIRLPYIRNHFPALIFKNYSRTSDFLEILEFNHYFIKTYGIPFTCLDNSLPMWIEVVHGHNVGNDVIFTLKQKPVYDNDALKRGFNWNVALNSKNTRNKFWFFFLPRFCSQFVIRGFKRILIILKLKSE